MADNLEAFIEQAEKINNGLGKSTIGKDKVKIKTPFNVRQAQSFVLKQQKDPVDDYFDCVSSCDTDNKECHDECTEELKENDTGD